jgi:Mor family transcriptional regulator
MARHLPKQSAEYEALRAKRIVLAATSGISAKLLAKRFRCDEKHVRKVLFAAGLTYVGKDWIYNGTPTRSE